MKITTDSLKYLTEGVVCLAYTYGFYVYLNIQIAAFISACASIFLLTAGLLMFIEDLKDEFFREENKKNFLFNIIVGIIILLVDIFVLVPATDGMVMYYAVPILIGVVTLFFTGLISVFIGIYGLIKK